MTWALCINCGELKFGAFCPCPECQVASTGDLDLDILFSDHNFTRVTLGALGGIIRQIKTACDDDAKRFWAFMKYMADSHPELFTLRLLDEYKDGVTALLDSLCLPTIELEHSHPPRLHTERAKEPKRARSRGPSNGSGSPSLRGFEPRQEGQQWLDGMGSLRWMALHSSVKWSEWSGLDLEDVRDRGDRIAEGVDLLAQGDTHLELLDARQAAVCYEGALAIARETGNRLLEEASLSGLGKAHFLLSGPQAAIGYHEQALEIARENGDRISEGIHLGNLGAVYRNAGEASRAIELHEQALEIAREAGNRALEANQLGNLGTAYRHSGATDRAGKRHEEALVIARDLGDRKHEGELLGCLGNDFLVLREFKQANRCFEEAVEIAREIGDRENEARWLGGMGNALLSSVSDYQIQRFRLRELPRLFRIARKARRAIPFFERAADIAQQIGDRRGEECWLGNLGSAYRRLGRMREAIPYFEQALTIAWEIGDRTNEAGWLRSLGDVHWVLRDPARAVEYYRQALTLEGDAAESQRPAALLYSMGLQAKRAGDLDEARKLWTRALALSESTALPIAARIRRALEELPD